MHGRLVERVALLIALAFVLVVAGVATAQAPAPELAEFRAIYQELVEINTTDSVGDTAKAAQAMAARLKAAGFSGADVQVLSSAPRKGNLVARLRGSGGGKPLLLLAHLDVVEARREDWSFDPFTLTEKDGYFYGRGTIDDKAMAAIFVDTFMRLKREGFVPQRDLILALTADEELGASSKNNGVRWGTARAPSVTTRSTGSPKGSPAWASSTFRSRSTRPRARSSSEARTSASAPT